MSTSTIVRRSRGFTLLELCAALCLSSILCATVAVSTRGLLDPARREAVVDRLAAIDGRLRDRAVRTGRSQELVIDLDTKRLETRIIGKANGDRAEEVYPCGALDGVAVASGKHDSGRAIVVYGPTGRSAPFAVRIAQGKLPKEWLGFTATTGRLIRTTEEPAFDRNE
jgi:type II secretory pathway pseudopilin PulG